MKIIPMRELKNTVQIEKHCKEEQGPVFVTKNGYGSLVVMDIDYYERIFYKINEAKMLVEGIEDIKNNRLKDGKTVIADLSNKYEV